VIGISLEVLIRELLSPIEMQVLEAIRHGDKALLAEYPGNSFDLM
jgi:hypothetical protein